MKEAEAQKKLLNLLESYGFFGFLHSTEFENFVKIFKEKQIRPRSMVADFKDAANQDVISQTCESVKNCLRFYYKEKTPTNYTARYSSPVMLVFDPALLFDSNAKFASGNAGGRYTIVTDSAETAFTSFEWNLIFERGFYSDSECEIDDFDLKKYVILNRRNAEFLYEGALSTDKVIAVYFKYPNAYNKAVHIFGDDCRFQIRPDLFD
jgi:hypothetical protein